MDEREILNDKARERIVFRVVAAESDGQLLELDDFWGDPEHEVGLHFHPEMEETCHVIAGSVEFTIGDEEIFAGPGDIVVAPPGMRHSARNVGGPAHIRIQMRPAHTWAEFVVRYFELENTPGATEEQFAQLLAEFSDVIRV